jgi:hypothetical protein
MPTSKRRPLAIAKTNLHAPSSDVIYWRTQPYDSRLTILEEIRQEFHQWKCGVQPRFQRVYTIIKR